MQLYKTVRITVSSGRTITGTSGVGSIATGGRVVTGEAVTVRHCVPERHGSLQTQSNLRETDESSVECHEFGWNLLVVHNAKFLKSNTKESMNKCKKAGHTSKMYGDTCGQVFFKGG